MIMIIKAPLMKNKKKKKNRNKKNKWNKILNLKLNNKSKLSKYKNLGKPWDLNLQDLWQKQL